MEMVQMYSIDKCGRRPEIKGLFFCELVVRRLVARLIDEAHYLPAVMESLYVQLLPLWGDSTHALLPYLFTIDGFLLVNRR